MFDFSPLVPAGLHHPRIRQYLTIKNTMQANPENLAGIEGLRMLALALKTRLEIDCFFVCPELLRGDASRSIAKTIITTGAPSFLISKKVLCSIAEWDGPDGLAAILLHC